MALASTFHIGILNELENMTVSSSPTAETVHPVSNVTHQKKGKVARWDLSAANLVSVKGTNATARTINCLILKGHNLASDSECRFRAYVGESQAGALLYDSASNVYGALPGTTTNYFSTPDAAANSITGDIEIRIRAKLADWTPAAVAPLISKRVDTGNQRAFMFWVATDGRPVFMIWQTGSGTPNAQYTASSAPTVADGNYLWLRVTLDVDDGAGFSRARFYTSTDYDPENYTGTWTQLGTDVTGSAGVSIFNSTAAVEIGSWNTGANAGLSGEVSRAQIFNGIAGTLAVDFDPRRWTSGSTFSAATTEVWTLNGTVTVEQDLDPVFIPIPTEENIAELGSWGSYYGPTSAIDPVFSLSFDAISPKSVQFDLHVPNPVNDIAEIDKLVCAYLWAPEKGVEWRTRFSVGGEGAHVDTRDGGLYTPSLRPHRRLDCNLPFEGRHSASKLLSMLERRGRHQDLYVMLDPNAEGHTQHMGTSIFRRDTAAERTRVLFDVNEFPLMLREN